MNALDALNAWADAWLAMMWGRSCEAAVVFLIVASLWLLVSKKASAYLGYGLFMLVLIKAILPLEIPSPARLTGVPIASHILSEPMRYWRMRPPPFRNELFPTEESGGLKKRESIASTSSTKESFEEEGLIKQDRMQVSLSLIVMTCWGAIVGLLLVKFIFTQWRMRRFVLEAKRKSPMAAPVDLEALKRKIGLRRIVHIVASESFSIPFVWGIFKPHLAFPSDFFRSFSEPQIRWIVLHELAHIKRHDPLISVVQKIAQIVYFFHPAVWIANRMIDRQKEYICDDIALLASQTSRMECGQSILSLTQQIKDQLAVEASLSGGFRHKSVIRRRMMRILDESRTIRAGYSAGIALALAFMACLTLPSGWAGKEESKDLVAISSENDVVEASDADHDLTTKPVIQEIESEFDFLAGKIHPSLISINGNFSVHQARNFVSVYDLGTKKRRDFPQLNGVHRPRISSNGEYIISTSSGYDYNKIILFHIKNLTIEDIFEDQESKIYPSTWFPDNKTVILSMCNKDYTHCRIYSLNTMDGSLESIKIFDEDVWPFDGEGWPFDLYVGPKGDRIVYSRARKIYLLSKKEGQRWEETTIDSLPINVRLLGWIPETNFIFLQRGGELYAFDVNNSNKHRLNTAELKFNANAIIKPIGFTKQGNFLYRTEEYYADFYIAKYDSKSGSLIEKPQHLLKMNNDWGDDLNNDWSPDLQSLVNMDAMHEKLLIHSFPNNTTREINLSNVPGAVQCPRWSSDIKSIVVKSVQNNECKYYSIDVDSEVAHLVYEHKDVDGDELFWFPDKKSFYFKQRINPWSEKWVRHFTETGETQDIDLKIDVAYLENISPVVLTPNGKHWIVNLCKNIPTTNGENILDESIYLVPTNGEPPSLLYQCENGSYIPNFRNAITFCPSNQYVYFVKWGNSTIQKGIWRIPISGGEAEFTGIDKEDIFGIRVHPDGDKIGFTAASIDFRSWSVDTNLLH